MKKKRVKSPIFLQKYREIIPGTRVRFDFPQIHQKGKTDTKVCRFFLFSLNDLTRDLTRSRGKPRI